MAEVKQKQAVGVVRVSVSIMIPELPEVVVLEFRQAMKEIVEAYAGAVFEMRLSEPLELSRR